MANRRWLGGATAVAQVSTVTLNNDFNDSETALSITLTAEDGSTTQSVSITPSGTDESTIAAALQAACDASTQSLFQKVTFTVVSNVITLTAATAGVPFYFASAVTGGAGTTTDATGTANAGPNDWNTAANWSGGAVPVDSDNVYITQGSFSILYGLDQSAITVGNLSINEGFGGTVGDPANGYSLQINGTTANVRASRAVWWEGDIPSWFISKTASGSDAVVLKDTTGMTVYLLGSQCVGEVRFRTSTTLSTVYVVECPRATVTIDSGVTFASTLHLGAGTVVSESDINNANVWGGRLVADDCGIYGTLNLYGGFIAANGAPDSGNNGGKYFGSSPYIYGGTLSFAANEAAAVTIETAMLIHGGVVDLRSGLGNITFDANPIVYGGTLLTDQGQTVNPDA